MLTAEKTISRSRGDFATHVNHAQRGDASPEPHRQLAEQVARQGHRHERYKEEVVIIGCGV